MADDFEEEDRIEREALEAQKKRKDEQLLSDLRDILKLPAGRRVLWHLLEHTGVFRSIWHPSALIHKRSGEQDVGHYVMGLVGEANEEAYYLMMRENWQEAQKFWKRLEAAKAKGKGEA